ncbi:MAG: hypothetical protein DNFNHJIP_00174 [Candidatus Argoarchaeum ethanivorans]|uniref:Uncharacterized protein n=1 Tax=Candidatus Argoarchaeum ethanivorans TaxID=2608793 RepID=A0A812A0V9_9EURY|nr:MAG: hypothetical protein DNFNHJIP_00174 [Candidatus Argoarchaeum ethanivorans]
MSASPGHNQKRDRLLSRKANLTASLGGYQIRNARFNSNLIASIIGAKYRMIQGILIGRDFGNQIEAKNELKKRIEDVKGLYYINCYTYSVKKR